jgi:hypothetical protein
VLGELSPTRTAVYARKSGSDDIALIGLNAKYYIDLVFENVRRQRASAGIEAPEPAPGGAPAVVPPGIPAPPGAGAPGAAGTPGTPPPAAVPPVAAPPSAVATPPGPASAPPRGE